MTESLSSTTPMPSAMPLPPGALASGWPLRATTGQPAAPTAPRTVPAATTASSASTVAPPERMRAEPPQAERQRVRVMVVDDQAIMRNGIRFSLLDYHDIEVVAMVGSGEEALEACARMHPDVVLMDLLMPGMGGMEAIAALHAREPAIHVVALTNFQDGGLVEEALEAGAIGYLLKDLAVEELAQAIRLAGCGIPTLAPGAGQALVQTITSRPPRIGQDLTQQERKVLELLTAGLSNQQIAEQLVVTLATVKFHIRRIRAKLGTSSRTETVVYALRHHLVPASTRSA